MNVRLNNPIPLKQPSFNATRSSHTIKSNKKCLEIKPLENSQPQDDIKLIKVIATRVKQLMKQNKTKLLQHSLHLNKTNSQRNMYIGLTLEDGKKVTFDMDYSKPLCKENIEKIRIGEPQTPENYGSSQNLIYRNITISKTNQNTPEEINYHDIKKSLKNIFNTVNILEKGKKFNVNLFPLKFLRVSSQYGLISK